MTGSDKASGGAEALKHWRMTLRLLWATNPRLVSAVLLITVCIALVPAVNVLIIGWAVGSVSATIEGGGDDAARTALFAGLGLGGVALAAHVTAVLQQYVETLLRLQMANRLNLDLMIKASRLSLRDYEDAETYDRLQLAGKEVAFRPYQLFSDLVAGLTSAISLVALTAVLVAWNPLVALVILVAPVPSLFAIIRFGRKGWSIENARAEIRRKGSYLQYLVMNDRTFKEIRLLRLAPVLIQRVRQMNEDFYAVDKSLERGQSAAAGSLGLLGVAAGAGAIFLAVMDSISIGNVGRLAGYLTAIAAVQASAEGLFARVGQLYEHTLFLGNMFGFMDLPERVEAHGTRRFPQPLRHGIEFRGLSFRYPGRERDALTDVSFMLPAGESLALVGLNGAGKTTLVKLLTRLYEPQSGDILVDGVPIGEYDVSDLRRAMGVLFQDFIQYEATVRENVAFGAVEHIADGARVMDAAHRAGADDVIEGLPTGIDSQLGRWFAGGQQLSGGQWQKIALARALFAQPSLLVLDEPTASIDAEAEAEIFARLSDAASKTTTLLIAHRFSTVRTADSIVVLDNGRVAEQGTHESLLAAGGRYAHLFTLQARGYAATATAGEA